ncbi:hypothetical protein JYU34_020031 [Plutella xylostella]|uniref:Uncharacterized protein n=1 Tax=Plutella xylostella TaxID=51655 RepID=A0ABQ7PVT9_PLUXY|nr:hypothetical protein JYU34_020031 [Plutella xylostella]
MSSPALREGKPSVQELFDDDYNNDYSDTEDSETEEDMMEERDWFPQSIFDGDVLESDVDLA